MHLFNSEFEFNWSFLSSQHVIVVDVEDEVVEPLGSCTSAQCHLPNQRFSLPVIHAIEGDYHLPVRVIVLM